MLLFVTFGRLLGGELPMQALLQLVGGGLRGEVEALRRQRGGARRLAGPLGRRLAARPRLARLRRRPRALLRAAAEVPLAVLRYRELHRIYEVTNCPSPSRMWI